MKGGKVVLYCSILYCTWHDVYHTVLYYAILYHTILNTIRNVVFCFVRLIYRCRTTFKKQTDILCVVVFCLCSKTKQIVVVCVFVSSGIPKNHSKSSPKKDPK